MIIVIPLGLDIDVGQEDEDGLLEFEEAEYVSGDAK